MQWSLAATTVGGILQIAGVVLVFIQIGTAEKLLGAVPWLSKLGEWFTSQGLKLLALIGMRRRIAGTGLAGTSSATTSGVARITMRRNRGTTVDERLASLQLQMDDARTELDELWTRSTSDHATFERKLAEVESGLRASDVTLRNLIAALTIGSRHLQVVGAVLIVLGTGLVTIAPFLQRWLR